MVIVMERRKAGMLLLLFLLLVITGVLWGVAGPDRLRLAQTTAPLSTPQTQPAPQLNNPSTGGEAGTDTTTSAAPQAGKVEVKVPVPGLFDDYRLERDRSRSAQVELLRSALTDKSLSEARREQLTAELFALLKRGERELQAETLLKAKGYTDAVVVLTENGANAVVPDVLERADAARVGELVSRATGIDMEKITIIDGASRT